MFYLKLCSFLKLKVDKNPTEKTDDTRQGEEEAVNANTSLKEWESGGEQILQKMEKQI